MSKLTYFPLEINRDLPDGKFVLTANQAKGILQKRRNPDIFVAKPGIYGKEDWKWDWI